MNQLAAHTEVCVLSCVTATITAYYIVINQGSSML